MSRLAARLGPLVVAPTDAELLGRFVAGRDEAAFAELVRRHGPAVLAVCRSVTRHTHDAEDAFQSAFLVLARRAGSVRPGDPLGAWLYGVAVRVSRRAAERPWRRREATGDVPDVPARAADPFDPDAARAVLDEVGQLSAAYRAAVVLCELEGRSRAAAARELGIAEGTLSSRLAAARKQLADRLAARGLAPAALAIFAGVAVPPGLASATSALGSGAPAPAAVAALARGVGHAMIRPKLLLIPLAAVASAALAAGLFAAPPAADAPPIPAASAIPAASVAVQPPAAKAAPRPLPKGPNKILVYKNRKLVLLDPDGKNETVAFEGSPASLPSLDAKLSPDGTRVAFLQLVGKIEDTPPGQQQRRKLVIRPVGGKGPVVETEAECEVYAWSPDGTKLAACAVANRGNGPPEATHLLVDAGTGKTTTLKLPSDHVITGWVPGDKLLTTSLGGTEEAPRIRLHLMNVDGTEHKALTDEKTLTGFGLPSPDGKRVLCCDVPRPTRNALPNGRRTLVLLDTATGKRAPVDGIPLNAELQGFCWSPDGTKIAYTWRQIHEGTQEDRLMKETESHLIVADPDGRNPRTVLTEKGQGQWILTLGIPDWR
ncbi:sigma-70 family RNA polymerase sigma factor [bacterium]|nr:sigma-70 family RNA polymerase sigma factor [bacterium]